MIVGTWKCQLSMSERYRRSLRSWQACAMHLRKLQRRLWRIVRVGSWDIEGT